MKQRKIMPPTMDATYIPFEKMPRSFKNVVSYHYGDGAFSVRTDNGKEKTLHFFIVKPGDYVEVDISNLPDQPQ